jgi:hypothetical protein
LASETVEKTPVAKKQSGPSGGVSESPTSTPDEASSVAGKSKLPEVVVEVIHCAKCHSTEAETTNVTRTPHDGRVIVRRWKRCSKCRQMRIERSIEGHPATT